MENGDNGLGDERADGGIAPSQNFGARTVPGSIFHPSFPFRLFFFPYTYPFNQSINQSINQSVNQSYIFRVAQVENSTARSNGRMLMNVQETVRK